MWPAVIFLSFSPSIFQLLAQCCAVATANTPKEPVCATVAGKGQNVMSPSASALTLLAGAMGLALKGTVSALLATKAKTVRKVNGTMQTIFLLLVLSEGGERTKGKKPLMLWYTTTIIVLDKNHRNSVRSRLLVAFLLVLNVQIILPFQNNIVQ